MVELTVNQAGAPCLSMTRFTNFGIESRRKDKVGVDKNWQSNLEIPVGGGFGWGMKFSSFGASKK